jgi:hypothetical protein
VAEILEDNMTTLRSITMVAALLAGGSSLALAQTTPSATGGAAAHPSQVTKRNCVGVRHGMVECRSNSASEKAASPGNVAHGTDTVILSAAQRRTLWDDLSKQATNQSASGEPQIGTFVPGSVSRGRCPSQLRAEFGGLGGAFRIKNEARREQHRRGDKPNRYF